VFFYGYAECSYAELLCRCIYTECRYDICHYGECRGAFKTFTLVILPLEKEKNLQNGLLIVPLSLHLQT